MPRIKRTITEQIDVPKDLVVDLESILAAGEYDLMPNPEEFEVTDEEEEADDD